MKVTNFNFYSMLPTQTCRKPKSKYTFYVEKKEVTKDYKFCMTSSRLSQIKLLIQKILSLLNPIHIKNSLKQRHIEKVKARNQLINQLTRTFSEQMNSGKITEAESTLHLLKKQNPPHQSLQTYLMTHFPPEDAIGCLLVVSYLKKKDEGNDLTTDELNRLKEFFNKISKNKTLNKKLKHLADYHYEDKYEKNMINYLYTYSYKIHKRDIYRKALEKLNIINQKSIDLSETINERDKLTLKDLRLITSLQNFEFILESFADLEIDDLKNYLKDAKQANLLITEITKKVQEELQLKTGDLHFLEYDKWLTYHDIPFNLEDYIHGKIVGGIGHATTIEVQKGKLNDFSIGHEKYEYGPTNFDELALSKNYRLQFDRLLTKKGTEWLKHNHRHEANFDVNTYLSKKYQNIISKLNQPKNFAIIKNNGKNQRKAGLYPHKRKDATKYEEINFQANTMICSEFTAKIMLKGLALLEAELRKEILNDYKRENDAVFGYEAPPELEENPILNYPIPTNERLERMHPGRLVDYISLYATLLPQSKLITTLIKF